MEKNGEKTMNINSIYELFVGILIMLFKKINYHTNKKPV